MRRILIYRKKSGAGAPNYDRVCQSLIQIGGIEPSILEQINILPVTMPFTKMYLSKKFVL